MKKLITFLAFSFLLVGCGSANNSSFAPSNTASVPADFTEVYFDDMSVTYNGQPHILSEVRGAPEGTQITYTGRETHTDVGTYPATAILSKEGYNSKTLTAELTISEASFQNITFESASFDYDGKAHSIYVTGAPSFATVTYTNNGKSDVGTYVVTAVVSAKNYNNFTISSTMRIVGKEITGVTLEDLTVPYDGKSHTLSVSGEVPIGVTVSYTNNTKTESGTYTVTASLTGRGFEPLTLTATLTIEPLPVSGYFYFYSKGYLYDGREHSVVVDSNSVGYTVTYKCLNHSGTNTFKDVGFYYIEATIKQDNNHISKRYATLTITTEATFGVDSSKTPLTIDNNLRWDDLYNALSNDNYTLKYMSGYYDVANINDPMPSNIFADTYEGHTSGHIVACDGKEAIKHDYSLNEEDVTNYYRYYKEVGDDIVVLYFDDSTYSGNQNKFPKAAFSETVAKYNSSDAFVALTKGDNGEFYNGVNFDHSSPDIGEAYIENGVFTVLMQHFRTLNSGYRYFYEIYKYYNIGNTTVNIPTNFLPSQSYIDSEMGIEECYLGGVRYMTGMYGSVSHYDYYYSAMLYVNYGRAVYLKPGTYTVLPKVYDRVVKAIVHTTSNIVNNSNQNNYNFRLYVDSNGVYQGEYAEYGSLSKFNIKEFTNDGGTVEYYNQWH